jgi:hypothetical protein
VICALFFLSFFLSFSSRVARIVSPVAPYFGCEVPQIQKYLGIVESAVFDCLGRPTFLSALVEVVMGRIVARIEQKTLQATADACATGAPQRERAGNGNSNGKSMRFAPHENGIRDLAQAEAFRLRREIELRFVETGILELLAAVQLSS